VESSSLVGAVHGPGDVLTCGGCAKQFSLSDIVRFIQHKVRTCPALRAGGVGGEEAAATAAAAAAALLNNNNLVEEKHGGGGGGGRGDNGDADDDDDDDDDCCFTEEEEDNSSSYQRLNDSLNNSGGVKVVKPSISAPMVSRRYNASGGSAVGANKALLSSNNEKTTLSCDASTNTTATSTSPSPVSGSSPGQFIMSFNLCYVCVFVG